MTDEQDTVCKDRGTILNYSSSQLVKFDKIKVMVLDGEEKETNGTQRVEN